MERRVGALVQEPVREADGGDFFGSFDRSMILAWRPWLGDGDRLVLGGCFRSRFAGSGVIFYLAVASLIVPSIRSASASACCSRAGLGSAWYSSALGRATSTWTLPFRSDHVRCLTASTAATKKPERDPRRQLMQTIRHIVVPICCRA